MFSDIVSIVNNVFNLRGDDRISNGTVNAGNKIVGKHNSIASMAKKSIIEYPIIISSGLSDDPASALKVVRHVERVYALFYSLAAGLNPTVDRNGTISSHIGQFGSEDLRCEIVENSQETLKIINREHNVLSSKSDRIYKKASDYLSVEHSSHLGHTKSLDTALRSNGCLTNPNSRERFDENFKKALGKQLPTVLTIRLYKGRHSVDVSIAVKAIPHFIGQTEVDALFDSVSEDRQKLLRLIKLTTGEISFFKDYILQMDRIARDQRLYARLGNHPLYRQLMARKNKSMAKTILDLNNYIKGVLAGSSQYLPTFTIMCTMSEVCRALKMDKRKLIDNPKRIFSVMDYLMLLGFVILDREAELVYSYYSSFDRPQVHTLAELTANPEDKGNKDMSTLLEFMKGMMR